MFINTQINRTQVSPFKSTAFQSVEISAVSTKEPSDSFSFSKPSMIDPNTALGYLGTLAFGGVLGAASLLQGSTTGFYLSVGLVGGVLAGATISTVAEILQNGMPQTGC